MRSFCSPLFITFEGGEGCGKSTQVKLLYQALLQKGLDVVCFREPGGTSGAEEIRHLLLSGEQERWTPTAEALLMSAARAELVRRCILPALQQGKVVICDRFIDSSLAYQGVGHRLGYEAIAALNEFTVGTLKPTLTFVFQLDPHIGLERVVHRKAGKDRYEQLDLSFHERVQDGYQEVLNRNPDRCRAIDARQAVEKIAETILQEIETKL